MSSEVICGPKVVVDISVSIDVLGTAHVKHGDIIVRGCDDEDVCDDGDENDNDLSIALLRSVRRVCCLLGFAIIGL